MKKRTKNIVIVLGIILVIGVLIYAFSIRQEIYGQTEDSILCDVATNNCHVILRSMNSPYDCGETMNLVFSGRGTMFPFKGCNGIGEPEGFWIYLSQSECNSIGGRTQIFTCDNQGHEEIDICWMTDILNKNLQYADPSQNYAGAVQRFNDNSILLKAGQGEGAGGLCTTRRIEFDIPITAPSTYYRLENNQCNAVNISYNQITSNDYLSQADCQSKIVVNQNPQQNTSITDNNYSSTTGTTTEKINYLFYLIPAVVLILVIWLVYSLIKNKRYK